MSSDLAVIPETSHDFTLHYTFYNLTYNAKQQVFFFGILAFFSFEKDLKPPWSISSLPVTCACVCVCACATCPNLSQPNPTRRASDRPPSVLWPNIELLATSSSSPSRGIRTWMLCRKLILQSVLQLQSLKSAVMNLVWLCQGIIITCVRAGCFLRKPFSCETWRVFAVYFRKWEQSVGDLLYCKAEWVIALKQRLVSPSLKTPQVLNTLDLKTLK